MTDKGTDISLVRAMVSERLRSTADHMVTSLLAKDLEALEQDVQDMSDDDLMELARGFVGVGQSSALLVGKLAYELRDRTPDGEWGRRKFEMANEWAVSDRTISRWMRSAQEFFGYELTPSQANAEFSQPATDAPPGPPAWEEDDDPADAGFGEHVEGQGGSYGWDPEQMRDVWIPDEESEIIDGKAAFDALIGEPWVERDSVTPSPEYTNVMPGETQGRRLLLEPDETWIAFTASQIQAEHPAFTDEAAARSALARWARKLETGPLDLLEELEMIHPEGVPDGTVEVLMEAEETKVIVPDGVTGPGEKKKGKRGPAAPKGLPAVAEKLMEMSRELHGRIHAGVQEGTVSDQEIASLSEYVQGASYTVDGLKKMVNQAKDRVKRAEKSAASAEF